MPSDDGRAGIVPIITPAVRHSNTAFVRCRPVYQDRVMITGMKTMAYAPERRRNTAALAHHACPVLGEVEVFRAGGPRSCGFGVRFRTARGPDTLYVDLALTEGMKLVPILKYEGQGMRLGDGIALSAQRAVGFHLEDHIEEMPAEIARVANIENDVHVRAIDQIKTFLSAPVFSDRRSKQDSRGVTLADALERELVARMERSAGLSNVAAEAYRWAEAPSRSRTPISTVIARHGIAVERHSPDPRLIPLELMDGEAATITDMVPLLKSEAGRVFLAHFNFDDLRDGHALSEFLTPLGLDLWEMRGNKAVRIADLTDDDTLIMRLSTPTARTLELACRRLEGCGCDPRIVAIGPEGTIGGRLSELAMSPSMEMGLSSSEAGPTP